MEGPRTEGNQMDRGEQLMDALWGMLQRRQALDGAAWKQASKDLNLTELRCIEYVGSHTNVNSTRLAEVFFMTTGATSKLTKKLMAKGLVQRYQRSDNRKAVYFRLTEAGDRLFSTLSDRRQKLRERDAPVFASMTEEEYHAILGFVQRYDDHLLRLAKRAKEQAAISSC